MTPSNGHTGPVRAIGIARVSTAHQRDESLEAQKAHCRRLAMQTIGHEPEWTWIVSRGSGEHLDRPELEELERLIDEGRHQFLFTESVDRIMRDTLVIQIIKRCVHSNMRVVANGLDTAQRSWRIFGSIQAAMSEEEQDKTSDRLKRQLRHEFEQGGALTAIPWGYRYEPPEGHEGGKRDEYLRKDPELEAAYLKLFEMLSTGAGFADVARWMNANRIPPPGRGNQWRGKHVCDVISNPIRAGTRVFSVTESKKNYVTGKRRQVPRERPLVTRPVPHLQMVEPQRHTALLAQLKEKNAHLRADNCRPPASPRRGRKRLFPTQILTCAICGRNYQCAGTCARPGSGGPLDKRRLRCPGSISKDCWVSSVAHYPVLLERLFNALVCAAVETFEDPEPLRQMVVEESADLTGSWSKQVADQESTCRSLAAQEERLLLAIQGSDEDIPSLTKQLGKITGQLAVARTALEDLERHPPAEIEVPSAEEVREMLLQLREGFDPADGIASSRLLQLVTSMTAYPFRLIGGRSVYTFVLVEIDLSGLCRPGDSQSIRERATRRLMLPAFRTPQTVRLLSKIRALTDEGIGAKSQSQRLGCHYCTVRDAQVLLDAMEQEGRSTPFVPLPDPAPLASNKRCHQDAELRPLKGTSPWRGELAGLPPLPDLAEQTRSSPLTSGALRGPFFFGE